MATQRLTVATLAGDAAAAVQALWRNWQDNPALDTTVDCFCQQLRAHGAVLPVIYFCEWVDRWLMGNQVPGPGAVAGQRFEVACLSPGQALSLAGQCGSQFPEQQWLANRLREASADWGSVTEPLAVVVVREVLAASTTDEEVAAALRGVPAWLSGKHSLAEPASPAE